MNVLSLFDGISCGQLALKNLGINVMNYYASEIEKNCILVTQKNFPNTIQIGDVCKLTRKGLPAKIDLLMAGSPCQGFSRAGSQLNFDDPRSKLFFEFVRIKEIVKPQYFLLENNRMKKEWENVITNILGVLPRKINSALVSAQNRERLYWTNIPNIAKIEDKHIMLRDLIGEYEGIWVYPRGFNEGGTQHYKGKSPTVTCSSWQYNFFIYRNGQKERFPIEIVEQLQTLPVGYTSGAPISQRYKMVGNCWTVDVISHLLSPLRSL